MRATVSAPTIAQQPRASTGIQGLDDILGGGLPQDYLYLVEGTPGAGKTTLEAALLSDASEGDQ